MMQFVEKYADGMRDIETVYIKEKIDLMYQIMQDIEKVEGWQNNFELEHFYNEMNDGILLLEPKLDKLTE